MHVPSSASYWKERALNAEKERDWFREEKAALRGELERCRELGTILSADLRRVEDAIRKIRNEQPINMAMGDGERGRAEAAREILSALTSGSDVT